MTFPSLTDALVRAKKPQCVAKTPSLCKRPQSCQYCTRIFQSGITTNMHNCILQANYQRNNLIYCLECNINCANQTRKRIIAKDLQTFHEWLDQIDKVAALTNNDPYKLPLAKYKGSFSKTINSYPPTLGLNKN